MKTLKQNHYLGFIRESIVYKTTALVLLCIMINAANLGAFYKGAGIDFNAFVGGGEFGNIVASVNMPLNIMEGLLNGGKGVSDEENQTSKTDMPFAVVPERQNFRASNIFLKPIFFNPAKAPFAEGVLNADLSANASDTRSRERGFIKRFLLLLIIFSALPRGIPVGNRTILNIENAVKPNFSGMLKLGFFFVIGNAISSIKSAKQEKEFQNIKQKIEIKNKNTEALPC